MLNNQKIQQKIEFLYLSETTRIQRLYQQEIANLSQYHENFGTEFEKLSAKFTEMKNLYKITKKQKKKAENSLKILNKEHDKMQKKYQDLSKTNQELINFIEKERENNKKEMILDENTQKNEGLKDKNEKISSPSLLLEEKGCDTQDLTHFFDESTNTEEKFFDFYKKFVVNKVVQTESFAKLASKPDIFDEFPLEKEKFRKRATTHAISGEFLENFNYKLQRSSIDSKDLKEISSNFRKLSENKKKKENDAPQKFDTEVPKTQRVSVIFNEKTIQEKKLPKYVRAKNQENGKNGIPLFYIILLKISENNYV